MGLQEKMQRVNRHWAAVDDRSLPERRLLLLQGVNQEAFEQLMERLPLRRMEFVRREWKVKLARARYVRRKEELHEWLWLIKACTRAGMSGTSWPRLLPRLPGLGQSFQYWLDTGLMALATWESMLEDSPPNEGNWPFTTPDGRTVKMFAQFMAAFELAFWAVRRREIRAGLARNRLGREQEQATALLMAYGHGVRGWLGTKDRLSRNIPKLWPAKKKRRRKIRRKAA